MKDFLAEQGPSFESLEDTDLGELRDSEGPIWEKP
jgi:hypothetical protein